MIVGSSASAADSDEGDPVRDGQRGASDTDQASRHTTGESPGLPKDVVFSLLSAERRRRVLGYMADHGDQTTLSDLADHIAAMENDTEIRLLTSQQRKRVYVALYQCHLPKMDDADVIDFNQARGTVERRPAADQLYAYIAIDPTADDESETSEPTEESTSVREKLETFLS